MPTAEQLIQQAGQRPTTSRCGVLDALLAANEALSHTEILGRLGNAGNYDRVTVYRVLDWLVAHGLIHKVAGTGRAWRFQANRNETLHRHAHFHCIHCGKVSCLPNIHPTIPRQIPPHFSVEAVELNLKGTCSECERPS